MMADEPRKVVVVQAIVDTTHFRAAWRGQCYEARALPSTGSLAVGDEVICHVLPLTSELVAVLRPQGELWFSPGIRDADSIGELYKYTGSGAPTLMHEFGANENVSHLFYCQGNSTLYACTNDWSANPVINDRIYSINRTTGAATLVVTWNRPHVVLGVNRQRADMVIDSAEFGNYVYLWCNNWFAQQWSLLERFDYTAGTVTEVLSTHDPPFHTHGRGGGVAVDLAGPNLKCSDGWAVYYSPTGNAGSWNLDIDLVATFDTGPDTPSGMVTWKGGDGLVHHGFMDGAGSPAPMEGYQTAIGNWSDDADVADTTGNGGIAFAVEGTGTVLWLARQGLGVGQSPQAWYKTPAGVWTQDWAGPGNAYMALGGQGIAYGLSKLYMLVWDDTVPVVELWQRDALGNWTQVDTYPNWPPGGVYYHAAMLGLPTSRYCHEV